MHQIAMIMLFAACNKADPVPSAGGDSAPDEESGLLDTGTYGDQVYRQDHLYEIEIEMDPDDWDELRQQERNVFQMFSGECMDAPFDIPYTWFVADVVIDGTSIDNIAIRKKGFIGSNSSTKPSLKLRFDEYFPDQRYLEVDRFTLNNGQQDPALISACLGFEIFRAGGVPASRCNFAHVQLNGDDLGVFANVEDVEEPMLEAWYGDSSGDLWEGQGSDFREGWTDTFELEEGEGDKNRILAIIEALEADDDAVLDELEAHFDLDAWHSYWAMEVLLGHWDGYAGNTNNYYLYLNPQDDRFHFLPWGIDALFDSANPFGDDRPTSTLANTTLPRRLYLLEGGPETYYARLDELLGTAWDEDEILQRIDAMEALIAPAADPEGSGELAGAVEDIRDYVRERRDNIEDEMAGGYPEWSWELREWPCLVEVGSTGASFDTSWGSYGQEHVASSGEIWLQWDGTDYPMTFLTAAAGELHEQGILVVAGTLSSGALGAIVAYFPLEKVADGQQYEMDWAGNEAYLYYDSTGTGQAWAVAAYLGDGLLSLEQASTKEGAPFRGLLELGVFSGGD